VDAPNPYQPSVENDFEESQFTPAQAYNWSWTRAIFIVLLIGCVHFLLIVISLNVALDAFSTPVLLGETNPNSGLASFAWRLGVVLSFPIGGPLNSLLWGIVIYWGFRGVSDRLRERFKG